MPTESTRCQFIDPISHNECDNWYPFEEGQKFCPSHRQLATLVGDDLTNKIKEVNHIPRTVTVISSEEIQKMNSKIADCMKMSLPELLAHVRGIDEQLRELERDKRAAMTARRNLEERLTEEERAKIREESLSFGRGNHEPRPRPNKKSPEEKAKGRNEGFPAWAARLGCKVDELMRMSDDEMAARIAKYKAGKGA